MNKSVHAARFPRVVIYRSDLLPLSETFIREQAEALRHFEPIYAGLQDAPDGLSLSPQNILFTSSTARWSSLRVLLYKLAGYSPSFESQIAAIKPSLLHAHFALDGAAVLPLVKHLNLPLIVSLHGYDVTSSALSLRNNPSGLLYLLRRRELWNRTHTFLCVSDFIRKKAVEAGFPEEKLRVHYTGVNCNTFSRSDKPRDGSILFVGRLVEKKGCRYLLDAMAEVSKNIPGTSLVVIGDGPMRGSLELRAKHLRINVRFLGARPASEVRMHMSQTSIFCVPSVQAENGDSEGFGMVFAEAQAMGTPVVSFNHGGIPEAVEDGRTGILVPERDTCALALAITQLLRDPVLWHSFSEQASDRIRKKFCLELQTRALESIYLDACNMPKAPHT